MKKNVLVIDDDPLALKIIVAVLEAEGYVATASSNAEDAFQKIHRTLPDLVLVDVVMPDVMGFDVCYKIKEILQPHPPPVIVMTGKLDAIDPILARKKGADDFVVKTSDMAVLVQAVRKIFLEEK